MVIFKFNIDNNFLNECLKIPNEFSTTFQSLLDVSYCTKALTCYVCLPYKGIMN